MAREFEQKSYFDHKTYSNVYYAAQIVVERFMSHILTRGDLSRVVWASDAYAFRKRHELVSQEVKGPFNGSYDASKLDFPFVNYYYDLGTFWEPDDRPAAQQTSQIKKGLISAGLPDYMRTLPVKTTFTATAMYQRDDDARLAHEILMWEYLPKGPIVFYTTIQWRQTPIAVPVVITLDQPQFNPQFNETDWLKTHRIYPIKFSFTVRTYTLDYPIQSLLEGSRLAPFRSGRAADMLPEEDVVITEDVVLNFLADKGFGALPDGDAWDELGAENNQDLLEHDPFTEEEQESLTSDVNPVSVELLEGYFDDANQGSALPEAIVSNVTSTSFQLKLNYDETYELARYRILVPGRSPVTKDATTDPTLTTFEDLYPSSEYNITIVYFYKTGGSKMFQLTVITEVDENNDVATPVTKKLGKLKGYTW